VSSEDHLNSTWCRNFVFTFSYCINQVFFLNITGRGLKYVQRKNRKKKVLVHSRVFCKELCTAIPAVFTDTWPLVVFCTALYKCCYVQGEVPVVDRDVVAFLVILAVWVYAMVGLKTGTHGL
jgi:hypothetical protein